jgi:hypothetical protein
MGISWDILVIYDGPNGPLEMAGWEIPCQWMVLSFSGKDFING